MKNNLITEDMQFIPSVPDNSEAENQFWQEQQTESAYWSQLRMKKLLDEGMSADEALKLVYGI